MPRAKTELKEDLRKRLKDLTPAPPGVNPLDTLCKEFNLNPWQVQYHLREPGVDRRVKYTPAVVGQIYHLSPKEQRAYAVKLRVTHTAVQAAIRRHRERRRVGSSLCERLIDQGWFRFGNPEHLHAAGITKEQVSAARKSLRERYKLTLGQDNTLIHLPSKRTCSLRYEEQVAIVRWPHKFVYVKAKELSSRWSECE